MHRTIWLVVCPAPDRDPKSAWLGSGWRCVDVFAALYVAQKGRDVCGQTEFFKCCYGRG